MNALTTATAQTSRTRAPVSYSDDDARWKAVTGRDRAADGAFFYSVRTTGVYCRPSCPGRLPRRENVRFHLTQAEAECAGFRPYKRCRPAAAIDSTGKFQSIALDWTTIAAELDAHGCATIGPLLTTGECVSISESYSADDRFRSRVIMGRHGFGRGEYKYFAYPLPEPIAARGFHRRRIRADGTASAHAVPRPRCATQAG